MTVFRMITPLEKSQIKWTSQERDGGEQMKKRVVLWLLILLLLMLSLSACGSPRPAAVVRGFMEAANRGDINTMLDCMEPDAANLVRGATSIAGDQFGIDADSVFLMAPGLMSIANANGAGYGMDYDILDESISGDRALLRSTIACPRAKRCSPARTGRCRSSRSRADGISR